MIPSPTLAPQQLSSVKAYLSWDHDRIDAILELVRSLVEQGRLEPAATAYTAFEAGLRRHIRLEEEIVFPLFESKTGMMGPGAVMRREHREIEQAIAEMRAGLDGRDAAGFRDGLHRLLDVLPDHNQKEEHILYPSTDRALSEAERTALVARLARLP